MNNIVVRVEKSGNRFNAFDANGVKYTSQITTGARKKAFNNNMALEHVSINLVRIIGGQFQWICMKQLQDQLFQLHQLMFQPDTTKL